MSELQPAHVSWKACSNSSSLNLLSGQQQQRRQLNINGALRFSLIHSSRPGSCPPFASLSISNAITAQPLFSLSRLTDSGSSSGIGSTDGNSSGSTGGAASSSGYESESDSGFSSDVRLNHINCQLCRQPLSQPGGKRRGWFRLGSRRPSTGSNTFLVCDCCQRAYHQDCCKDQGISTKEDKDGSWFHSSSCKDCLNGLQQQASAGAVALPEGRSWQLIDCSPVFTKEQGGMRALQRLKQNLGDVLEVLLPAYGPGVAQQLVNNDKGYAVVLRKDSEPVTAALLDVYGQECAVLDLVATQLQAQGQGHCRTLLHVLEGWLGQHLGVRSLMAVCPEDEPDTIKAWQQKFGFKRLNQRQLRQIQASIPPLNYYEDTVLLAKDLPKQHKEHLHQQQEQPLQGKQQQ